MPIDINTASKEVLVEQLNLSSTVADRLIRIRKGSPIRNVADLEEVDGIGPAIAKRISERGDVVFAKNEGEEEETPEIDIEGGFEAGGVTVEVETGKDGKPTTKIKLDLAKLVDALSKSSKNDREEAYRNLVLLWENWADLVKGLLRKADKEGLDDEDVAELRRLIKKLRRVLKKLRRAVDDEEDDEAKEKAKEAKDLVEEIESLLED